MSVQIMADTTANQLQVDKISQLVLSNSILGFTYLKIYDNSSFNVISTLDESNLLAFLNKTLTQMLKRAKLVEYFIYNDKTFLLFTKQCKKVHIVTIFHLKSDFYENLSEGKKASFFGLCLSITRLMYTSFRCTNQIKLTNDLKLWYPHNYQSTLTKKLNLTASEITFLAAAATSASSKELALLTGCSHHYLHKISAATSKKLGCTTKYELQEIARIIILSEILD
ncbi:MAG: hypothetical protein EP298_09830 [Gammaproteobacteria bacterium]|nr:MAG: hypothetical protein EP298_09830 [Gammaproteobacteria bacterium]UTW43490.1 hypothetical protein KFE69_05195 [bacterium SCSIO 12844]